MKVKAISFNLLLSFLLLCSSCSSNSFVDSESVIFCFLDNAYITENMTNWRIFADILYYDGSIEENAIGVLHNFDKENNIQKRLVSFPVREKCEAVRFGFGYIDGDDYRIPAKSDLMAASKDKVYYLNVSRNGYVFTEDSKWDDLNMTFDNFVDDVFSYFNPNISYPYGYNSYMQLNNILYKNIYDINEEKLSKKVVRRDDKDFLFIEEWNLMKDNYLKAQDDNNLPFLYIVLSIMFLFILFIMFFIVFRRDIWLIRKK